jgi:hypothetical protein
VTRRLFAAALVLAVVFGAGELVARTFLRQGAVVFPRYEADYTYGPYTLRGTRARADFWHTSADGSWRFVTNSKGFRNAREFAYTKPVGTLRVLSLGGADAFGYEARQDATYAAVAQRFLARRHAEVEVLNAAVPDYGMADALAFMIGEGYKYAPDVLVLGVHAGDFARNAASGLFALEANGQLKEARFENLPGSTVGKALSSVPPARWVAQHSYLLAMFWRPAYAAPRADVIRPSEREVELASAILERLQRICAARNTRFIVVDIPQLDAAGGAASSLPDALRVRMARLGIESVSADELLAPYYGGPEMHVAHGERHLSEFAHALIGVELGRRLLKKNPS